MYAALCRAFATPRPPGLAVEDLTVAANGRRVPVRVYRPRGAGPWPVLVYAHGGGWVLGGLDSHDAVTADLAARGDMAVIAVDYRLAPAHPFPAALDDVWAVVRHVAANPAAFAADPARLMVGGDSAGGNLAAAVCLRARAAGGPAICKQILIYPELGLTIDQGEQALAPSAPLLARGDLGVYWRAYLGDSATTDDPLAAPLLTRDYTGLPPAYIAAAAHDPLRNDARVYAERLRAAGGTVEVRIWPGLVHGFLRARGCCAEAEQAFDAICDAAVRFPD